MNLGSSGKGRAGPPHGNTGMRLRSAPVELPVCHDFLLPSDVLYIVTVYLV